LLLTGPYDRAAIDDRLGEGTCVGKRWDGWVFVDSCEGSRIWGGLCQAGGVKRRRNDVRGDETDKVNERYRLRRGVLSLASDLAARV